VHGADLAEAAIITRDNELPRLAARWAMSLAVSPNGEGTPYSTCLLVPGRRRAFSESYASEDLA